MADLLPEIVFEADERGNVTFANRNALVTRDRIGTVSHCPRGATQYSETLRNTEAIVRVEFTRNRLKMTIMDNGRGFELFETSGDLVRKSKLGLAGIQERVRLLIGSFSVKSQLSEGTVITIEVET